MERFTYYRKPINKYYLKGTNSAMVCFNGSNPCEKLGKLEDLEEQLGMPLLEFLNLIGKDIYVIACESYEYYLDGVSNGYYSNAYERFKEELYDYPHKKTISFLYESSRYQYATTTSKRRW